ncbi:hypothetical protein WJX73_001978 [Symbiochloris irregularis]|uniref:NAD(+) diphosphatase n=1 Tax=Symbiochloris irregularis TaxID=706552 RepID=A0AAW1PR64_9CHLO
MQFRQPLQRHAIQATAEFLLIAEGRSLCVSLPSNGDGSSQSGNVKWFSPHELGDLGLVNHSGVLSVGGGGSFQLVHPVLLGKLPHNGIWRLALDVSPSKSTQDAAKNQGLAFQDLRSLLPLIPAEDLSIAGQAVALLQWHKANEYCGRCGARTTPVEMGGRRQCTSDKSHRAYPRTDPVMITLVESTDGQRALLGRPKSLSRRGVLTCLSGFIEQGESIEECVRREVMEEAGVSVGQVAVLGSQPWPIGRGGTCEVMIGCMAKALDDTLHVNEEEMDAVRWVTKQEAQTAIQHSSVNDVASSGQGAAFAEGHLDFFIPPKWAIAHHLIKAWATQGDSWFSKL